MSKTSKSNIEKWQNFKKGELTRKLAALREADNSHTNEEHPNKGNTYFTRLMSVWLTYHESLNTWIDDECRDYVKAECSKWCHTILAVSNKEFTPECINFYHLKATTSLIELAATWGKTIEDYKQGLLHCEESTKFMEFSDDRVQSADRIKNNISKMQTSLNKKIAALGQNLNAADENANIMQDPDPQSDDKKAQKTTGWQAQTDSNLPEQIDSPVYKIPKQILKKQADAGSIEAALAFAKILCEDKDYDQALEYFNKVRASAAATTDQELKATALINIGKIHYHHKAKPILELFEEAYKADPNNTECRINLAKILCYHQGKYFDSIEHFKYCLENSPKDYDALLGLAKAYLGHGMPHEESLKALDNLLAVYPNDTEGLLQRGKVLAYHVNTPEAKDQAHECFSKLYALDSKNTEGRINLAKTLCYHKNKYYDSVKHFEYYLERNPGNYDALLGIVKGRLASSDNYEQSLKALDNLLAIYPNDIEGLLQRSKILTYYMDKPENSGDIAECIAKVRTLDPSNTEVLFVAGKFYMNTGDNTKAVESFKQLIAADSTFTHRYTVEANSYIELLGKFSIIDNVSL